MVLFKSVKILEMNGVVKVIDIELFLERKEAPLLRAGLEMGEALTDLSKAIKEKG